MSEELKFSKFVNDRQIVWDASSLDKADACLRLYDITVRQGWKPKGFQMITGFGSAVHLGLQILDEHKFHGVDKEVATLDAITQVLDRYGEGLAKSEKKERNVEAAMRAVVWYADEFYSNESYKVAPTPAGDPACEIRFEVPFPHKDYRLSGRIDKIYENNGKLYITDFKTTTSNLSDYFFNRYYPSNQIAAYIWATRHMLELPVGGFVIDGIQTGVNYTRFKRRKYTISEDQIDEWVASTCDLLDRVEKAYETGEWHPNYTACGNYGGCSLQDYCSQRMSRRQLWLEEDFNLEPYGTREYVGSIKDD